MRWVAVMARHPDEGTEVVRFTPEYFHWLEDQVFSIQDFPYDGVDFRGDPDMVLPRGEQWDDTSNFIFHKFFKLSISFLFLYRLKTDSNNFQNADVGPRRSANFRPFERRLLIAAAPAPQDEATETLAELDHDLERLTADIPETTIDDIPIRLQHFVVRVPGPFRRFLCRVARAVVSYRDHHQ